VLQQPAFHAHLSNRAVPLRLPAKNPANGSLGSWLAFGMAVTIPLKKPIAAYPLSAGSHKFGGGAQDRASGLVP